MHDDDARDDDPQAPPSEPPPEPRAAEDDVTEDESLVSSEESEENEAIPEEPPAAEPPEEDEEDADDLGEEDEDLRESWPSDPPPRPTGGFPDSDLFKQQRKRLEGVLRDVLRKAVERGVEAGVGAIEQSVDVLERSVEVGRGRVKTANSVLRDVMEDVRIPEVKIPDVKLPKELPKEIVGAILGQIEEGKNVLVGAVASEVRGFLEQTDVAYELQRVLTSLSFEISTEIRFVPNERGVPRAEVKSKARPKVSSRRAPRRKRDEAEQEPDDRD